MEPHQLLNAFSFFGEFVYCKNCISMHKKMNNRWFSNILKIYTIFASRILYFVWNSFTSHIANRAATQFCWNDVQLDDFSFKTCANLRQPLMHLVKLTDKIINWMPSLYVKLAFSFHFFTSFFMVWFVCMSIIDNISKGYTKGGIL